MRVSRPYLYLSLFASGCATLGVEISAAHLLRAVYGTSNIVWATVIGVMLLFLALGYRLGGRWADRPAGAQPDTFYRLLAWAGFTAGAAAILTRLLLRPAAAALATIRIGPVVGSFVVALALLAVPVVLLGCVSPYAVRLALGVSQGSEAAGSAAGRVYAASTLGSFVGSFLPPLLLIPLAGARSTYWILAGGLLLAVCAGLRPTAARSRAASGARPQAAGSGLLFSVFAVGLVSLGAEVTASRLLGPTFGDSNLVWAAVIGVSMMALAAGYYAGGRLADRVPDWKVFLALVGLGAMFTALTPLISRPVLDLTSGLAPQSAAGFALALVVSAGSMLAVPMGLLGSVAPFAVRLMLPESGAAGRTAGGLYAISTVGSLVGAFLPVLWLIPVVGAAGGLLAMALALCLVAVLWLLRRHARHEWAMALLPVLLLAGFPLSQGPVKDTPGQLFEAESAYNYVEVVERQGVRYLLLNEGQGVHSVYDPSGGLTMGTWDYYLAAPFFNSPPHRPADVQGLALVGLAAGTISKQYTAVFGPLSIDGIEIDPAIVAAGRDYFAMTEPNLNVIVGDGRYELGRSEGRYDVVAIDAYRLPYIPWHLTTREFFGEVRDHLSAQGVVAVNVGRTPTDRSLVEAMIATLTSVFPSVHVMDVPETFNTILVATVQPTTSGNLRQNLALLEPQTSPLLTEAIERADAALRPTVASTTVFTDDRAPVEMMTNRIVIDFVLSGEASSLGSPMGN